ncbi:hypothetical protein AK830_g9516 [Neonectria ditissima]|uniref:Uncharacterized protein n=1 Tax=Neonectria ditissima TaxID=78410 RepID=A0A0N8H5T0_9HYPO|nr:hypothetical protein AK830_g9516 [Neonectria ditissima]
MTTAQHLEFHTRHATPRRLSQELRDILGEDANIRIEMRHNIYNIMSDKAFDLVSPLAAWP